jgi:hypothetical protein
MRTINHVSVVIATKAITTDDYFFNMLDLRDAAAKGDRELVSKLASTAADDLLAYITANSTLTAESLVGTADSGSFAPLRQTMQQHVRLPLLEDTASAAFEQKAGVQGARAVLRLKPKPVPRSKKGDGESASKQTAPATKKSTKASKPVRCARVTPRLIANASLN